jgi:MFS family permease
MKSFEEISEERIGFGKYQYIVMILLGTIFLADGIEMSALTLIIPLLKAEWNISEDLQGLLGSVMFLGLFFGSLVSGLITDIYGRKRSLEYITLIQFFLGIYTITITNVYMFLFIRGIFGFMLGYVVPLVPTLCAELIPMEIRGKTTVVVNTMFSIGQFLAGVIAYFCLDNLSSGNWRLMLLFCSFPPLLVWFGSYWYLIESPRYIVVKDGVEKGIEVLNQIGKMNKGDSFQEFNMGNDYRQIKQWRDCITQKHGEEIHNSIEKLRSLFNSKNNTRLITICMWTTWFCINFVFYGVVFILPFFLNELDKERVKEHKNSDGITSLIITTLGEGASGILAYFLVDHPIFGRKNSLALAQLISSVCCLFSYFLNSNYVTLLICFLTVGRFFAKMCFAVIYPLTAEIYSTHLRTIGIGMASAIGRVAGCIMPLISIKLFYSNIYLPFLLYFFFGTIGLISTYLIPYDTLGLHLDMNSNRNSLMNSDSINKL